MKRFKQGTLGAGLTIDPRVSLAQAKKNIQRVQNQRSLRALDHALRHGEDVFEPISDTEAVIELNNSGIFLKPNLATTHIKYHLPHRHPEEEAEHVYDGDNPRDPECWGKAY